MAFFNFRSRGGDDKFAGPSPDGVDETTDLAVNEEVRAEVLTKFPSMAIYMRNPELAPILILAVEEGWSEEVMLEAIRQTQWWQETDISRRSAEDFRNRDPATWQTQLDKTIKSIEDVYATMGVELGPDGANGLALAAMTEGWDEVQLQSEILDQLSFERDFTDGVVGSIDATMDSLRARSRAYHVPMGDEALWDQAFAINEGRSTFDGWDAQMKAHAKSLYQSPELAAALDAGGTVEDFAAPYRGLAARELGVPEASIDMASDKFNGFLNHRVEGGPPTIPTMSEWQKMIRTESKFGWADTAIGKQAYAEGEFILRQAFGAR